jgi:hypothetical protein
MRGERKGDGMANVQSKLCAVAVLCLVLAVLTSPAVGSPGDMDRHLIDPADGIGKGRAVRQGRGIKLHIHYTEVDTLVVDIEYTATAHSALSLKRIGYNARVRGTDRRDAGECDSRSRAGGKERTSPLRRVATAWAVLSGLFRIVVAILGILLF